jgi:hypothetical protein
VFARVEYETDENVIVSVPSTKKHYKLLILVEMKLCI